MYGIKDGIMQEIPKNSYLKDGSSVSNYDLMSVEELTAEGWSEIQEEIPTENTL